MSNLSAFWERVLSSKGRVLQSSEATFRAEVPGGWLVRHEVFGGEGKSGSTVCHYPDHDHAWLIDPDTRWEVCYHRRGPNDNQITCRLNVPGGWIVRDGYYLKWKHLSLDLVFVPDPDHLWLIPGKDKS